jgi:uncharacterized membrane protein
LSVLSHILTAVDDRSANRDNPTIPDRSTDPGWRQRLQAPTVPAGPVIARRWAVPVMVAGIITFAAYHGIIACIAHDRFNTYTFDLGIFDQGMWLMSRFTSPFISLIGRHLFGDHTSFILIPLVPLYWLVDSAKVLLVVQAVALGIAAWPVFGITRDLVRDERIAVVVSSAFLLHPALGWTAREQFHPDSFEVPLLAFALWFMLRRRWAGFYTFVGLALLVKEDVPLMVFALGLYIAVRYSPKVGLITAGVAVAYFVVAVYVVLDHFNGVGTLNAWRVPFGGIEGLVSTTFTHPWQVITYVFSENRPWYVLQMLAPLALVPLLSPGTMLIAIGPLMSNVLSTFSYQHGIKYHYGTLILPVLALATAHALTRFNTGRRAVIAGVILFAAIGSTAVLGPALATSYYGGYGSAPSPAAIQAAFDLVPPDAVLATYYRLTPHADHRQFVYDLPNPFTAHLWGVRQREGQRLPEADTVEYVVVPTHAIAEVFDETVTAELQADFEVISDTDGVLVLRRMRTTAITDS